MNFKYAWFRDDVLFMGPAVGEWDWDYYFSAVAELFEQINNKPHDVYVIADLSTREALPPYPIANMRRMLDGGWPPDNVALIIGLNPSPVAQLFLQVFTVVYLPVDVAHSLDAALKRIDDHKRGRG